MGLAERKCAVGHIAVTGRNAHRATLESKASCSAASPVTFSPRLSFSSSKPPSYFPMSMICCCLGAGADFAGEAGRDFAVVELDVTAAAFECPAGKGLGAANLDKSLLTFVPFCWLGFFWWVAPAGRVVPWVLGLEDISSAAICRVTAPREVIVRNNLDKSATRTRERSPVRVARAHSANVTAIVWHCLLIALLTVAINYGRSIPLLECMFQSSPRSEINRIKSRKNCTSAVNIKVLT